MNEKQSDLSLIQAEDVQRFKQALDKLDVAEQTFRQVAEEIRPQENVNSINTNKSEK
jgi:hypothetical protein